MAAKSDHYDCLILGSGIAGYSAAEGFRKYAAAKTLAIMTPDTGELYSPCALPYFVSGRMTRDQIFLKNRFDVEKLGVTVLNNTSAVRLDPANRIVQSEGRHAGEVHYDRLVLAIGSYPFLPICGAERLAGLFTFKSFSDALNVKNYPAGKAVVVGSGLIGVEAAASLVERGVHVTLIEARPRILPALLDSQPAELMRKGLEGRGLTVLTDECVTAIAGDDAVEGVSTTRFELPAELVIMAIGMKPNMQIACSAGIALGSTGGIWVDNYLKTSAPNIYACGDCVESRILFLISRCLTCFGMWPKPKDGQRVLTLRGKCWPIAPIRALRPLKFSGYRSAAWGLPRRNCAA